MVLRVPDAILLWRLTIVREVVLSGFQMELYSMEERAFAYWYVAQVIEAHLDCIDNWVPVVSKSESHPNIVSIRLKWLTDGN